MRRQDSTRLLLAASCAALIVLYMLFLASRWVHGGTASGSSGPVVGGDFAVFWAASAALRKGGIESVLDPEAYRSFSPVDAPAPWYRWVYPPTALLLVVPFAYVPYVKALIAWSLSGLAAYSGTVYATSRRPAVLLVALAFPGVFITLLNGQLGLVVFALFGLGLLLLPTKPLLAGALLGLMAFKPQHAWLVPVALAAGRRWTAFASAAATLLGAVVVATAAFGIRSWEGALGGAAAAADLIQRGTVPHCLYVSVFGAARLAGVGAGPACALQVAVAVIAALAVARVWSGAARHELKAAALAAASLFGNYYVLHYDLVLLGVALLFAVGAAPWSRRSMAVFAVAWALPLFAALLAQRTGVQAAPLVAGAVLLVVVRRAEAGRRAAITGMAASVPPPVEHASSRRLAVEAS